MNATSATLRPARPEDVSLIVELIRELADFERLADQVEVDPARLDEHLFGPRPYAECVIAWVGSEAAGFALFFHNYSTFLGRPGIYLEDLFVRPVFRGQGHGEALLRHLASLAVERRCGRLEWSVLDWNQRAIDFYRKLGAEPMDEWTVFRVSGFALERLAADS
jgi:GNAT superfamily N-acetyltransferase